jgi:hypothetical protein
LDGKPVVEVSGNLELVELGEVGSSGSIFKFSHKALTRFESGLVNSERSEDWCGYFRREWRARRPGRTAEE